MVECDVGLRAKQARRQDMKSKARLNKARLELVAAKVRKGAPLVVTVARVFPKLYRENPLGFRMMVVSIREKLGVPLRLYFRL